MPDQNTTSNSSPASPRNLRFPPAADDRSGAIAVEFEVENESHTGALLKLNISRGQLVTVTGEGKAPCTARIARVAQTEEGMLHLAVTWEGVGVTLDAGS